MSEKYVDWRGETLRQSIVYRLVLAPCVGIAMALIFLVMGNSIVDAFHGGVYYTGIAAVAGIFFEIVKPRHAIN